MIELTELRELCIWRMVSDPFPLGPNDNIIDDFLNKVSQSFGFQDWIDAYHNL